MTPAQVAEAHRADWRSLLADLARQLSPAPTRPRAGTLGHGDHPAPPRSALRAVAHGLPPRRQRPRRAVQLARGPPHRRRDAAAGRGHRPRAVQLRAGREHPRLAALARARLGRRDRLPGRPPRRPPRGGRCSCSAEGKAYWCDCTAEAGAGPGQGARRPARLRRLLPRPRARRRATTTALRFRAPDDGTTSFADLVRGEVTFENTTIEDFVLLRSTGRRCSCCPTPSTTRTWASPTWCGARTTSPARPSTCCSRDALGLGRPEVFAHLPLLVNEGRKKLSKRKDVRVGRRLRGPGLPARGDGQLPRPARLGPDGRRGDPAAGGDRRAVPARGRHVVAGLLRRQEAAGLQRRRTSGRCRSTSSSTRARPFLTRGERGGRRARAARRRWCRSGCACSPRSSR